jgi:hypothetical protein
LTAADIMKKAVSKEAAFFFSPISVGVMIV